MRMEVAPRKTVRRFTSHGSLFLCPAPRDQEAESKCAVERVIFFNRGQVAEVEPVDVITDAGAVCQELAVAGTGVLVEVPEPDRDQAGASIPVLQAGSDVHLL